MPRSSRHKSSKHGSRDGRDRSDSEDYSSSRDRKSKDESNAKVSKDFASREKRKLEEKDVNGDYKEEYSTSKRRKDRVDDDNDRWNGGDDRREGTKKLKDKSSESRSKRRQDSSSKKEGKKDGWEKDKERGREKEKERDRRGKEKVGKTEKLIDADDLSTVKQASEKTELSEHMDRLPDRRTRKKRDDFSDGDLNHDDLGDSNSRGDVNEDGRLKEEKRKDERYKYKYRESVNTDYRNRYDKENVDIRPKKHRPLDGDRDSEWDHDCDFDASGDNDRETYRRERQQDRDRGRERDRKHDREWDRKKDRDRDREREHDRDRIIDDRNSRYKDSKGRKRSLDDYDDYADAKSSDFKTDFLETEKRSLNSRMESDDDRGKSGKNAGSDRKTSPDSTSLVVADEFRQPKQEDMKYKDNVIEHRLSKSERNSKYRSTEKHNKVDEGNTEQLSIERSSTSKTSVRRNLDIEESGRRSNASMGSRDDDRPNRDLTQEKSLTDDSASVDSPFYNRTSQGSIPPSFRGGVGRGQGNAWRGGPNWTPPLPNGYIPFQQGPHHGAFPAMLPQFSSPLFGVRPSMEINHSGIPYHISDADRFASHIGPLGWQTMRHWDGNNVFGDEQNLYGGPDWDQSRHSMNNWKGQNGNLNSDASKEDFTAQAPVEEVSAGQGGQRPHKESNRAKAGDTKTSSPETTLENMAATPKSLERENALPNDAYLSRLDVSAELADPELYDQIASFLSVTTEDNFTMLVNLKDGGRAVPKCSSVLLSSLLFPETSDSVFQRAMGIYKRQRACFHGLPIIDAILVSKTEEEEAPPNNNKTVTEGPILCHNDEVLGATSIDSEAETLTRVAVPGFSEVTLTKQPEDKSETAEEGEHKMEVEIGISETKGSYKLNNDDGISGPLGSLETESESVILSRIHHSPESTH